MSPARTRILEPGDEEALLAFLVTRPDTTMFLRGNLRQAGLVDRGEPLQGTYAAAFEGDRVVAVAGHFWNGNVILEAPVHLREVLGAALAASSRDLRGLVGTHAQVVEARTLLALEEAPAMMDSHEVLYALDLADLRVPEALATGEVTHRRASMDDLDVMLPWRLAYDLETLGADDTPAFRKAGRQRVTHWIGLGNAWVLEQDGRPVSMTGFNAVLPDCVQVGGVYTPPELRSRGHARAAVAGSLLDARADGATRTILFTAEENHPARACYEGLGYEIVGDYGLVLFRHAHRVAL